MNEYFITSACHTQPCLLSLVATAYEFAPLDLGTVFHAYAEPVRSLSLGLVRTSSTPHRATTAP